MRLDLALDEGLVPQTSAITLVMPNPNEPWGDIPAQLSALHHSYPEAQALAAKGIEPLEALQNLSASVVCATKDRIETLGHFAQAYLATRQDGYVAISGPKLFGIDGTLKRLTRAFGEMATISKAHGKLSVVQKKGTAPGILEKYVQMLTPSQKVPGIYTQPGLFSAKRVDEGSAFLAEFFDEKVAGKVADLGSGWGWLSYQALQRCPGVSELCLYESDRRALHCARQNVIGDGVSFHWSDVRTLQGRDFDWVISNPPFHLGQKGVPELGQDFIATAAKILKPKGKAFFVANRHLPYEQSFAENFSQWSEVATNARFKVISAANPKKAK